MKSLLQTMIWLSIRSGVVIAAVVLLRLVFRRAPKWTRLFLWGIAALSLLLPFRIESPLSLMPQSAVNRVENVFRSEIGQNKKTSGTAENTDELPEGAENIDFSEGITAVQPDSTGKAAALPGPERQSVLYRIITVIWLLGVLSMMLYAVVSYLKLRRRTAASIREDGVWICDDICEQFILGVVRPRIYLPSGMDANARKVVLAHENAHLKSLHHIWKAIGFLLLCLYWFHPLVWAAWFLFTRDLEMACDERVVRTLQLDENGRADYSQTLLSLSMNRPGLTACPLAFGENDVKSRVKEVLNYKKAPFWIIIAVLVLGAAAAIVFLTVPKNEKLGLGTLPFEDARIRPGMSREELRSIMGEPYVPAEGEPSISNQDRYKVSAKTAFGEASEVSFYFSDISILTTEENGEDGLSTVNGLTTVAITLPDIGSVAEGEELLRKIYGEFSGKEDGPNIVFLRQQNVENIADPEVKEAVEHGIQYVYDYPEWAIAALPDEEYSRLAKTLQIMLKGWPLENTSVKETSNLMRIMLSGYDNKSGIEVRIETTLWSMLHENTQ